MLISLLTLGACTKTTDLPADTNSIETESYTARNGSAPLIQNPQGRNIPDAFIVVLNDDVQGVDTEAEVMTRGLGGARPDHIYKHTIKGFSIKAPEAAIRGLLNNPKVKYIEQDQVASINAVTQTGATWGLDRVDQRALPLNGNYTYISTGSTVDAYIFDTGILPGHNEFGGRVVSGYDAFGGNTIDTNGHGTHVAGTVGGSVYGIAKGVTLFAVRVLNNSGSGTWGGIIAGVDWAVQHHAAGKPAVGNMSLGGGASTAVNDAVKRAITDGIVMVVAAGNANAANYSPARTLEAITVGATTSSDARASYSNFGSVLDIFAPGSSIVSAGVSSSTAIASLSGTSMASPHVAGAAALYLEAFPGSTPAQVQQGLTSSATPNLVTSAGTGSPNLLLHTGTFSAPPPPPPAPVAPTLVFPANGATGISTIPTLTWNSVTGAVPYDVQVSTRSNFSTLIQNSNVVNDNKLTTRSLKGRTIHFWRVRSRASNGTLSAWSSTWSFTTR